MKNRIGLAVHGGAGTIMQSTMTPSLETDYKAALELSLQAGYSILKKGGSSLDAVEAAVILLEDCPLYNAGRGSVFTSDGRNELDASIMYGKDLSAGAVAAVTTVRNPVSAARAVMERSDHVLLVGTGAEEFAKQQGLAIASPDYFFTQERWDALHRLQATDPGKTELDHGSSKASADTFKDLKFGTVGAVALDSAGNLAAATSTGGMTNTKWGRIGDSALIGAGTYANQHCAVSCTGWGEFFIRLCIAKTIADLMEFKGVSLQEATEEVILEKLPQMGGDGGLIAIDKTGIISMPFSTAGMYRGCVNDNGEIVVSIYRD